MKPTALLLCVTLLWISTLHAEPESPLKPYRNWSKSPEARQVLDSIPALIHDWLLATETIPEWHERDWPGHPTGVFVTAMKDKRVRACVGTLYPTEDTMGGEILLHAKRLLADDPRHPPLDAREINSLRFVISFTGVPRAFSPEDEVDIWNEGVSVQSQDYATALLPGEARTWSWGRSFLRRQFSTTPEHALQWLRFPVVLLDQPKPESESHATRQ